MVRVAGNAAVKAVEVSIVLVNYNGGDAILNCLGSIFARTRDIGFEVLAADNASTDGSPERIQRMFPTVNLIRNAHNLGFSRACNQALAQSRGRAVLLLNGDTLLLDNAVGRMADFLAESPEAGIAGCMLLREDGTCQKSAGRARSILNEFREKRTRAGLDRQARAAWQREVRFARRVRSVDWVSGAFLMIRRQVMERIGLLDERMFLCFEDIDWCARARKAGWKVLFNPFVRVIHLGGHSVSQNQDRSRLEYRRSQVLYYRNHHGSGPDTQILRLYLLALAARGFLGATLPAPFGPGAGPEDRTRSRQLSRELFRLALRGE
jgi:N-acetylglucosaminyl-diphospho-decaprenol L-rhamnosyltransferase